MDRRRFIASLGAIGASATLFGRRSVADTSLLSTSAETAAAARPLATPPTSYQTASALSGDGGYTSHRTMSLQNK